METGTSSGDAIAPESRARGAGIRAARAELKREVTSGEVSLLGALRTQAAAGMEVEVLVRALDRVGRKRARAILAAAQVREDRLCSDLTRGERERLLVELERRWRTRRDSRSVLHGQMRRPAYRARQGVASTPEQRAAARNQANRVRLARAALLARINRSETGLVAAVATPEARDLRVRALLGALPYVGDATARSLLRSARIPATRTCGELRPAERGRLLAEVQRRCRRRMPTQLRRARAHTADVAGGGGGLAKAA